MNPNARQDGFTLIELLVVVAIIAILAAMLMPALSSARESARQTVCKGRVKEWTLALHFYTETFAGYLPWQQGVLLTSEYTAYMAAGSHGDVYMALVAVYGMNNGRRLLAPNRLGSCPSASEDGNYLTGYSSYRPKAMDLLWNGSFGYNRRIGCNTSRGGFWDCGYIYGALQTPNVNSFKTKPSRLPSWGDGRLYGINNFNGAIGQRLSFRHKKTTGNLGFMDGRVNSFTMNAGVAEQAKGEIRWTYW